jgi:DNA-binding LytR/AlgR family response regulator
MGINIAICDDEQVEIAYLVKLARDWADSRGIPARFFEYMSAEGFLFEHEDGGAIDILLLDIQMEGMDGVRLARKIREKNDATQIIFITGYPDFIADGYDVSALHYLMKPVKEDKLLEVLDRAISRIGKSSRTITFPKTGGGIKIKADDIIYAEVLSHTVVLHLANGSEEFTMRISDMEELLGEGFFRCHRSFIVSMERVKRVTRQAMVLDDGREVPLSRNLYDAANRMFINYY